MSIENYVWSVWSFFSVDSLINQSQFTNRLTERYGPESNAASCMHSSQCWV